MDNYDNQREVYARQGDRTRAIAAARSAVDVEAKVVARDAGDKAEQTKAARLEKELATLRVRARPVAVTRAH